MTPCLMLDVDGVLITGRPSDGRPWYSELEADLGIDPSWLRSAFFAKDWSDIVRGRAELLPRLQDCLAQLDRVCSAEELVSYWFNMDSRINLAVLADCANLRDQGVRVYLATNQEHCRAHFLMNDMGLAAYVDGIIYSAQLGSCKPDPEFYELATEIAKHSISNILLVDDTLSNIIGAQNAGWKAVHWTNTSTLSEVFAGNGRANH
jgi:putative hydrolase of the HAD superfamily